MKIFDFGGQDLLKAPLSRERFALALRRGQGRALLHVRKFGLAGVADLVLEACLHHQTYDPQCEDSRAPWLFEMFRDAPEYPEFSKAIQTALGDVADNWDLRELSELAALMARHGDLDAVRVLRERVLRHAESDSPNCAGFEDLVMVDGVDAVIELARRLGKRLLENPENFAERPLEYLIGDLDILPQVMQALAEHSVEDQMIRAYFEHIQRIQPRRNEDVTAENRKALRLKGRKAFRAKHPLKKILGDAATLEGNAPNLYSRFGSASTLRERKIILQKLVNETNEGVCLRLLWVFFRTAPPELHPRLWKFVESENAALRSAALEALSQLRDDRVGDFGRAILQSGRFTENDADILGLFARNLQPTDVELILTSLRKLKLTDDNAHAAGHRLLDIFDENESSDLCELLDWIYEMTPCSMCREMAVYRMTEVEILNDELVAECLCDVDEDTRALARKEKEMA